MKGFVFIVSALLIPLCSLSQNPFDSKKKTQKEAYSLEGFKVVSPSKNARRALESPIFADFSKKPLYKKIKNPQDNSYYFIENIRLPTLGKKGRKNLSSVVFHFLETIQEEIPINKLEEELKIEEVRSDEQDGKHIKLHQHLGGIEVYGGEIFVHLKNSKVTSMNGHLYAKPPKTPLKEKFLSEEAALEIVFSDLKAITTVQEAGVAGGLLSLKGNQSKLYYYKHEGALVPAYELIVRPNILERWVYFVHALSGEVLSKYDHTCTLDGVFSTSAVDLNGLARSFVITQEGSNYFMVDPSKAMFDEAGSQLPNRPKGAIWTIDAGNGRINDRNIEFSHVVSQDGRTWSPTAVSAHTNASLCYDYYEETFQRNSLNNSGGNIVSVINITDEDGNGMDNAYWNGEFMGYGNGNRAFGPLAGALDVAGHEMTHGVIENTAKLEYRNQSGALNESFADIFGAMVDRDDWTLGEDIVRSSVFPSGALRSLANPNQGGKGRNGYQPKNMSQYEFLRDIPSEDNGGVHVNSGIPNHAFYLFATGNGMSKSKAEQVYYHALSNYLTRTSQFLDLRLAVEQSTKDLYGSGSELIAAQRAFDEVGIIPQSNTGGGENESPTPSEEEQVIPTNPGDQFLIVYEPESGSIYNGPVGVEGDFSIISEGLGCRKKPSVTDDGSRMFFVGLDRVVYTVDLLNPNAVPERVLQNDVWANVAVSKNGRLLAALTDAQEPYIYVIDLLKQESVRFELYNPTYTQGLSTGEVLYADSFEWDYSGEYLIYDAFNRARGVFGDLEYWDVGILRAWNVASDSFGEGDIQKIFSDLDEGDNIGNPAIAKTNPNVLSFDYLNSESNKVFLLGVNLLTNKLNIITENNTIGFPDFSVDDKILAFNTLISQNQEVVSIVGLGEDRISNTSNQPTRLFGGGQDKWAVFYARGQRQLPQKQAQEIVFESIEDQETGASLQLNARTNSNLPVQYSVVSGDASISGDQLICGNTAGRVSMRAFQIGNEQFTPISTDQSFCIKPIAPIVVLDNRWVRTTGRGIFQWYLNGRPLGGQTSNNFFNTSDFAGAYTVKQITEDGCESNFSNTIVTEGAILSSKEEDIVVHLYPNPVLNKLQILLPKNEELQKIELKSIQGQKLLETSKLEIDLGSYAAGSYVVEIVLDSRTVTKTVVKL